MVSTERVLDYCRLPQEANLKSDRNNKPPDDWPANGSIEVRRQYTGVRWVEGARRTVHPSLVWGRIFPIRESRSMRYNKGIGTYRISSSGAIQTRYLLR